jgi:hypothetical protein
MDGQFALQKITRLQMAVQGKRLEESSVCADDFKLTPELQERRLLDINDSQPSRAGVV